MTLQLTVVAPCYQEQRHIKGWLENCRRFADHIIISEGGSTDGTREIIGGYERDFPGWITVLNHPQNTPDYGSLWHESERRGALFQTGSERTPRATDLFPFEWDHPERRAELFEAVNVGFVVALDVDEMLPEDFREIAKEKLDPVHQFGGQWHNFWRSPHHIRVGTDDDPHWGPTLRRFIFPAHTITAGPEENHTSWICGLPLVEIPGLPIFHYHYLFMDAKPAFDNRYHEMRGFENRDFLLRGVSLRHPEALRHVVETVNFGDFAGLIQGTGR